MSGTNLPPHSPVRTVLLLATGMAAFSLFRLIFLFVHRLQYQELPGWAIAQAFLHGWRFDFAAACLLILPALAAGWLLGGASLLGFVSSRQKTVNTLWFVLALLPFGAAFIIYGFDLGYYADAGRRLSYEVFRIGDDLAPVFGMVGSYKGIAALFISGIGVYAWINRKLMAWARGKNAPFLWLALPAVLVIGIRGGFQSKPLRPSFAYFTDNVRLAHLALNPVYTVLYALKKGQVEVPSRIPPEEALKTVRSLVRQKNSSFISGQYPLLQKPVNLEQAAERPNIVVLLMESWAAKYVGSLDGLKGITPNFDRLAAQGLLFTRFYAVGVRSTDGITAVNCSIPTFEDLTLIGSSFEENNFRCMGRILGEEGYETFFLHGAKTGSFGLKAFAQMAGFKTYIGKEDFPSNLPPSEIDATWGVYDHAALERFNQELKQKKEPFLGFWFSLTAHAPYHLPSDKYHVTPAHVPDSKFIDTLIYSDESLGRFFEQASKEDYFKRTVFIILADHTAGSILKGTKERHHIPCLIYAPHLIKPGRINAVGSQLDILPTVLALTRSSSPHHSFGRPLTEPQGPERFAFVNQGGLYGWIRGPHLLLAGPTGVFGFFDIEKDPYEMMNASAQNPSIIAPLEHEVFSYVQMARGLLRDNRLAPLGFDKMPSEGKRRN